MTAPTHQGVTTAGDSSGQGITGVTRPTTTADDLFILDLYYESGTDETSGAVAFSNGTWVLEKRTTQTGSSPPFTHLRYRSKYVAEGSTFNITWNATIGTVWRAVAVDAYRLVDTTTPDDAAATGAASASSTTAVSAPGLTTVTADALGVWGEADFLGTTVATLPTGYTSRTDFANLAVADKVYTSAGATGAQAATLTAASWNTASLIALRPATPGGGGGAGLPFFMQADLLSGGMQELGGVRQW